MVRVRFPDDAAERRALGFLPGRFSFRSFADGITLVPEPALAALAIAGISFTVEGPATYDQRVPAVLDPAAAPVQ